MGVKTNLDLFFLKKYLLITCNVVPGSFSHFGTFPGGALLICGCGVSRVVDSECPATIFWLVSFDIGEELGADSKC